MHVGMEKTVAQRLGEERAHQGQSKFFGIMTGGAQRSPIADRRAVNPFAGEDTAGGAGPVHMRHAKFAVAAGAIVKLGCGGSLHAQIQFQGHRSGQGLHQCDQPQPARFRREKFRGAGKEAKRFQVAREITFDARPQNLDRSLRPFGGGGLVHLGDGGGGHWWTKDGENFSQFFAQRLFDQGAGLCISERRQAVLQMFQRRGDGLAHNIGPRRQHLAQLDIGRALMFQHLRQPGRLGTALADLVADPHRACGVPETGKTEKAAHQPPVIS